MDLQRSMKLSLIFGLAGAVLVPFLYEIYANVSTAAGLFLVAAWTVFVGIKFSFLSFKEAFLGITCTIAYSGILGFVCYIIVHPAVQNVLEKNSVYFQLTLQQQAYFVLYTIVIFLCMYVIWLAKFGVQCAIGKLKNNRDKAGEYIDNAFEDEKDEQK